MNTSMDMDSVTTGDSSGKNLCLLSLDGGGVRGLSSLLILKNVMESLNPTNPPKPCEYFDMIGGTSTGGLIAIMLGRLRMTVDDCIQEYMELSPEIFEKIHHRFRFPSGEFQGRFNHEALEKGVRGLLQRHGLSPDELFRDTNPNACKTFVCATTLLSKATTVLSSYYSTRRGNDLRDVAKIFEVARATSAATSFFDSIKIGGEEFVDGATGANNPVNYLWREANDTFCPDREDRLEDHIQCLVSIGTGIPLLKAFDPTLQGIAQSLLEIATDAEKTAEGFHNDHARLFSQRRAFRFNVRQGLETINLESVHLMDDIQVYTRNYIASQEYYTLKEECTSELRRRQLVVNFEELLTTKPDPVPKVDYNQDHLSSLIHTSSFYEWKKGEKALFLQAPKASHCKPCVSILQYLQANPDELPAPRESGMEFFQDVDIQDTLGGHCCLYVSCGKEQESLDLHSHRQVVQKLALQLCWYIYENTGNQTHLQHIFAQAGLTLSVVEKVLKEGSFKPFADLLRAFLELDICLSLIIAIDGVDLLHHGNELLYNLHKLCSAQPQVCRLLFSGTPDYLLDRLENKCWTLTDDTEYEECLHTLYVKRHYTRRKEISQPEPGTTEWIWSHKSYVSWTKQDSGILWIEGKPGSGKSVLAARILDSLTESEKGGIICDWFYSTRGGEALMSHESLFQSLLFQILHKRHDLFSHFQRTYRKYPPATTAWITVQSLMDIMFKIAKTGIEAVFVVDALDESEDECIEEKRRETILSHFTDLVSQVPQSRLKFLVLSRPSTDIHHHFRNYDHHHGNLGYIIFERENNEDIKKIIQSGVASLQAIKGLGRDANVIKTKPIKETVQARRMREMEEDQCQKIMSYLEENTDGVILWVTVVLSILKTELETTTCTYATLNEKLKALPTDLHALYSTIFKNLKLREHELDLAKNALMWTSGANMVHPLSIMQLHEALAIPNNASSTFSNEEDPIKTRYFFVRNYTEFRSTLRRLCGPLIEIVHPTVVRNASISETETTQGTKEVPANGYHILDEVHPSDSVQLLHRSVKDYLADPKSAGVFSFSPSQALQKVREDVQTYITISCPQTKTEYAPDPIRQDTSWRDSANEMINYVETRSLLPYILAAFPEESFTTTIKRWVLDTGTKPQWISDDVIEGGPLVSLSLFVPDDMQQAGTCKQKLWEKHICAEYVRLACHKGLTQALSTIISIMERYLGEWKGDHDFVGYISHIILLTAIRNGLFDDYKFLVYHLHGAQNNPHWPGKTATSFIYGNFTCRLSAYEKAAVDIGDEKVVEVLYGAMNNCLKRHEMADRPGIEILLETAQNNRLCASHAEGPSLSEAREILQLLCEFSPMEWIRKQRALHHDSTVPKMSPDKRPQHNDRTDERVIDDFSEGQDVNVPLREPKDSREQPTRVPRKRQCKHPCSGGKVLTKAGVPCRHPCCHNDLRGSLRRRAILRQRVQD